MTVDEKARSGLMLAGGISRKLEAFCQKPLLPPPENRDRNLHREESGVVCLPPTVLLIEVCMLCKCQRRSLLNVTFVFGFMLLNTDVAQQFQVVQM